MAITYKYKVEKPTTADMFWFEAAIPGNVLLAEGLYTDLFKGEPGYLDCTIETAISWDELVANKDMLRPDLKVMLEEAISQSKTATLEYNPLSTTSSAAFAFDTMENFTAAYNLRFNSDPDQREGYDTRGVKWKEYATTYNNTVTEELYVDDALVEFTGRL